MDKDKKILLITIFLLFSFLIVFFKIIYPSYLSFFSVCNEEGEEILKDKGYITGGSTSFNIETKEIKIVAYNKTNILKHEFCHVNQIKRGYPSMSCYTPYQKLFTEIECYSVEKIPTFIYNFFYQNI